MYRPSSQRETKEKNEKERKKAINKCKIFKILLFIKIFVGQKLGKHTIPLTIPAEIFENMVLRSKKDEELVAKTLTNFLKKNVSKSLQEDVKTVKSDAKNAEEADELDPFDEDVPVVSATSLTNTKKERRKFLSVVALAKKGEAEVEADTVAVAEVAKAENDDTAESKKTPEESDAAVLAHWYEPDLLSDPKIYRLKQFR